MNKIVAGLVPIVTDFDERGVRQQNDVFSRLLKDRIIFLNGEINEHSALLVVSQLLVLDRESHKDIHLYISSPGGSVYAMFTIIDIMSTIRSDVSTIGCGFCASAGAVLLACGTRGKRFITNSTRVMIHQPSSGAQGTITDMQIQFNESMYVKKTLNALLSERMGKREREVAKLMERDYYMSAEEALKRGIVDAIFYGDLDKKKPIGLKQETTKIDNTDVNPHIKIESIEKSEKSTNTIKKKK